MVKKYQENGSTTKKSSTSCFEMKFHSFTTDSPDFFIDKENLCWSIENWHPESLESFALSSCLIHFKSTNGKQMPMRISCNLADENYANYDGTICSGVCDFKNFSFRSTNLEFWKIDCARPRTVVFTLRGIEASTVKFCHFTLALR